MPDRITLRSIAEARLQDARVLLNSARYDGAAYVCGYAVELALKARICHNLDTDEYPERLQGFKIHDLDTLLFLSGREKFIRDNHFATWSLARGQWRPEMRYQAIGTIAPAEAQTIIEATNDLLRLL